MTKPFDQGKHRTSKVLFEISIDAAANKVVLVVCDRCKREQPNAHARDEFVVGCLACNHFEGMYKEIK